jgi:hypothetical protein
MAKPRQLLVIIVSLIGAAVFAAGIAFPFAAQPKVTWSPSTVYAGITSTTTVTKTLTFTSDQALIGVTVEAIPEIARFIQIQPNKFAHVPAGQPQTVQLIFSAPAASQFGAHDGTIHIRAGSSTLPQTLKTSVTFAVVTLPPDWGTDGISTVAGIDSDRDGVRDDVERYVAFTYPNSARLRTALMQIGRVYQSIILQASDKTNSRANWSHMRDAMDCLEYLSNLDQSGVMEGSLEPQIINTIPRSQAWLQANSQESGHAVPIRDAAVTSCTFDPAKLED